MMTEINFVNLHERRVPAAIWESPQTREQKDDVRRWRAARCEMWNQVVSSAFTFVLEA